MPAPTRSRVPVEKLTLTLPRTLYEEIVEVVKADGGYLSAIDFLREAAREKLERWKSSGHRVPEGPGAAGLVDDVRRRRAP